MGFSAARIVSIADCASIGGGEKPGPGAARATARYLAYAPDCRTASSVRSTDAGSIALSAYAASTASSKPRNRATPLRALAIASSSAAYAS